jgi:Tol biopolymer transport system component
MDFEMRPVKSVSKSVSKHGDFWCRVGIAAAGAVVCAQLSGRASEHGRRFGPWQPAHSVDASRTNGINTPKNDGCPIEAPDPHRLFFASDRTGTLDVFVGFREAGRWLLEQKLPSPVNTDTASEFCPDPLPGNQLLFVSTGANNCGPQGGPANADIYYTRVDRTTGQWIVPQPLSCNVNSGGEEFSPSFLEAEGRTVLYFSSNRDTGVPGRHKIYASDLLPDGTWSPAQPVVELNSDATHSDARPNVRADGLEIVFDSTRAGGGPQIYAATRHSVIDPWSDVTLLDHNVNVGSSQTRPTLSRDGKRLYFGTNAANQPGDTGSDIFVSKRPGAGEKDEKHER